MIDIRITDVRFIPATPQFSATGLLGWATCVMDDAVGIALGVRKTLEGRITLSFPAKSTADGRMRNLAWPVDQAARDSIEAQVIDELRRRGHLPTPHSPSTATSREQRP